LQDKVKELANILNSVKQLDDCKGTGELEAELLRLVLPKGMEKDDKDKGIDDESQDDGGSKAEKKKGGKCKCDSEKEKVTLMMMGPPKEQLPGTQDSVKEPASQPATAAKEVH
jgi:hypothetical protein